MRLQSPATVTHSCSMCMPLSPQQLSGCAQTLACVEMAPNIVILHCQHCSEWMFACSLLLRLGLSVLRASYRDSFDFSLWFAVFLVAVLLVPCCGSCYIFFLWFWPCLSHRDLWKEAWQNAITKANMPFSVSAPPDATLWGAKSRSSYKHTWASSRPKSAMFWHYMSHQSRKHLPHSKHSETSTELPKKKRRRSGESHKTSGSLQVISWYSHLTMRAQRQKSERRIAPLTHHYLSLHNTAHAENTVTSSLRPRHSRLPKKIATAGPPWQCGRTVPR